MQYCCLLELDNVSVLKSVLNWNVHITATLDQQTIHDILRCRFSRILIFDTSANDIVGTIHVKDLVFVDPKVRLKALA